MSSQDNVKGLENIKEALKKDLISQADYDAAKDAFLRVEQLSLAMNVGLIEGGDLAKAKVRQIPETHAHTLTYAKARLDTKQEGKEEKIDRALHFQQPQTDLALAHILCLCFSCFCFYCWRVFSYRTLSFLL